MAVVLAAADPETAVPMLRVLEPRAAYLDATDNRRTKTQWFVAWALADPEHAVELADRQWITGSKIPGWDISSSGILAVPLVLSLPESEQLEIAVREMAGVSTVCPDELPARGPRPRHPVRHLTFSTRPVLFRHVLSRPYVCWEFAHAPQNKRRNRQQLCVALHHDFSSSVIVIVRFGRKASFQAAEQPLQRVAEWIVADQVGPSRRGPRKPFLRQVDARFGDLR